MYLHLLTPDQQESFCKIAMYIMAADGVIDNRESRFLETIQKEIGWPVLPARAASKEQLLKSLDVFTTHGSKSAMLIEAVGVAMADGVIADSERTVLEEICDHLDIPRTRLSETIDFAQRYFNIVREGQRLLTETY